MKLILIITDHGSFNNFLSELAVAILQNNIELHVICSRERIIDIDDKNTFDPTKINFHYVNIPREISISGEIKAAIAIKRIIDKIQPDLVHIHFTTAAFPALLLKRKSVTYWATFHGLGMNSSFGIKKIIFAIVEVFSFIRLDRIFTVNNKDTKLVNKLFKKKAHKYSCYGFGCDIEKFNIAQDFALSRSESANNISPNDFVIAYTGRFVDFKGFHLVIKSFKILKEIFPGAIKLILIGGNDPIHSTGLDEEETKFLHSSNDIVKTGYTKNVAQFLSISNLFLFPSLKEGLPTCILEALSMGIPVVTFDARGNNDVVTNDYNGILVEPEDSSNINAENIVKTIKGLFLNREELKRLSDNALKKRIQYSRQKFVGEHLDYYKSFLFERNL